MRKFSISIFLSALSILAFINAGILPVQHEDNHPSISSPVTTGISAHINYPETEIEHTTLSVNTAISGHFGVQKSHAYYPGSFSNKIPVIASALYSPTVFEKKELFDNNYLSHNYPSQNFW